MLFRQGSRGGADRARAQAVSPRDNRKAPRTAVPKTDRMHVARFGDRAFWLENHSEGGFAIEAEAHEAPKDGWVVLARGETVLRQGYAVQAWGVGRAAGFQLMDGLRRREVAAERRDRLCRGEAPEERAPQSATLSATDLRARLRASK